MANEDQTNSTPICTVDPYQYMQIKKNQDGTITRFMDFPSTPPTPDPNSSSSVLSNDFPLNPTHNTYVRVFLPKIAVSRSDPSKKLLPVIVYYHGGGFVLLHADSSVFHDFCSAVASHVSAIVVSVEYRLAPEHRLPAAYEDAVDSLSWIRDSFVNHKENEWLCKYGDASNCFLMGTSAGGNIAYHTAFKALNIMDQLQPLSIKGMILHHPFFGGPNRTESELSHINDPYLPLSGNDLFWELSLPKGADRDHEFCNPLSGDGLDRMERIKETGLQVLVTECSGDPLVDRLKEFVKVLEEKGVQVKGHFTEGDYHGLETMDHNRREGLLHVLQAFVNS